MCIFFLIFVTWVKEPAEGDCNILLRSTRNRNESIKRVDTLLRGRTFIFTFLCAFQEGDE